MKHCALPIKMGLLACSNLLIHIICLFTRCQSLRCPKLQVFDRKNLLKSGMFKSRRSKWFMKSLQLGLKLIWSQHSPQAKWGRFFIWCVNFSEIFCSKIWRCLSLPLLCCNPPPHPVQAELESEWYRGGACWWGKGAEESFMTEMKQCKSGLKA